MTFIHDRSYGAYDFAADPDQAPNPELSRMISQPGANHTLTRARLGFEARIAAYSQTDSDQPLDFWWSEMFGVVGLWYTAGASAPSASLDPLANREDPNWIIWNYLHGEIESMVTTPHGFHRWTRVYRGEWDMLESFAERNPHGAADQSVWLSYSFNDPTTIIDRSHDTFDVVYDLQYSFASDLLWRVNP